MGAKPSAGQHVDTAALRRIADSWPGRASVHNDLSAVEEPGEYDASIPDYPLRLLPFADHDDFVAAPGHQRDTVLTMAWLVYNERVITAEEQVANPTFRQLVHGVFPGADSFDIKRAVQQTHVDETFHTYMHMLAMHRSREVRQLTVEPDYPPTVTYRRLVQAKAEATEQWQRDLLSLIWTTVSEVSVNAYLTLLSRDDTIQPMHSLITRLHARDESAHSSIAVEVLKSVFPELTSEQQALCIRALPTALNAFMTQDYSAWRVILHAAGFAQADAIVDDCEHSTGDGLLVRDFSGIRRLVRDLGIENLVEFPHSLVG